MNDAELIRLLDGELASDDRSALSRKLGESPDASLRLHTLRKRSASLSALLQSVDPSDTRTHASANTIRSNWPQPARTTPLMKMAAAIALLLGLALAAPPARAWLLDQLQQLARVVGLAAPANEPIVPNAPVTASPQQADLTVTFDVDADTFELHIGPADGVLLLRRAQADRGTAEATGVPATSFLVVPGGLRIDGTASADATFTVSLPARVRAVRLHRANGQTSVHLLPTGPRDQRIELR